MQTIDFDYSLPKDLVAQAPEDERPRSRLLVLHRSNGSFHHRHFADIVEYLKEGDLLVLNDTKVIPARLIGYKRTGGAVDILLTEPVDGRRWFCLVKGVKQGVGSIEVSVGTARVLLSRGTPFWTIEFSGDGDAKEIMAEQGRMPLPNYIKRGPNGGRRDDDYRRYQTVYARVEGSIAAPTAGLHFDEDLLSRIRGTGVKIAGVTLHIGIGTFFLIKSENVEDHVMHREFCTLSSECAGMVSETKKSGGRVIAVGTSAVRTLESACSSGDSGAWSGYTGLYIYPGYRFRVVDGLVTNFHLPRSTPLMLVSAFAGKESIRGAYEEAIEQRYRFYSYGDAMFIS
jgi:S-adenosylmethionine:tRNA ribosyltransferase-isomerase